MPSCLAAPEQPDDPGNGGRHVSNRTRVHAALRLRGRHGNLHRDGVMRLATAADEILPLKDPRVQANQAYLVVILLSRVITRLGGRGASDTQSD